MNTWLDAITGWTLFGGLLLALGCVATRWIIAERVSLPEHVSRERMVVELGRLGIMAAFLTSAGVALAVVRQLLEFRDPFVPWGEDARLLLLGTAWGRVWLLGALGAVLSIATFAAAAAGRRSGWWLSTLVVLALAAYPAFTGHAAGDSPVRPLLLVADVVHVWGAGAWIGGLAALLHLERRLGGPEGPSLLPTLVPVFSRVAVVSVAAVVITGSLAGWVHLSSLSALVRTAYGRTLALKLALVVIVLGLGATNFRIFTPKLGTHEGDRALKRAASVELLVAQVVLLVTAILVRTPPGGM